jgi:hypothetical protein
MPLQNFDGASYLRSDRIFVNTNERDVGQSHSKFDFQQPLDQLYEKIVSMELVSWNLPFDMAPCIFAESELNETNNLLDVEIRDVAAILGTQTFTVELLEAGYKTVEDMARDITRQLNLQMQVIGGTYSPVAIIDGGTETVWHSTVQDGKISFFADSSGVPNSMLTRFLFTSGPSAGSTPATVLGFQTEADTITEVSPLIIGPTSTFPVILSPLRFVDVFVSQIDELSPVMRIPLSGDLYDTDRFHVNSFRLLTQPVRKLQELNIRLEMIGGLSPEPVSTNGFDLIFDVLLLAPQLAVPSWTKQLLAY